jgi:hypothetical protein
MAVVARASSACGIHETETRQRSALGILLVILAEFRRAIAATRRYEDLRWGSGRGQGIAPADIPPRIFEEFYALGTAVDPRPRAPSKAGNPPDAYASAGDLSPRAAEEAANPPHVVQGACPTKSLRRPASTISGSGRSSRWASPMGYSAVATGANSSSR